MSLPKCWLCTEEDSVMSHDGLCEECAAKMDGLSFPIKCEEVDRLRCISRIIESSVYRAIKRAEQDAENE